MPRSPRTSINQDPLKPWKHTISLTIFTPNFTKALLAISIFALLSLYYFSILPGHTLRLYHFPDCDDHHHHPIIRPSDPAADDRTNISHILFGIGGSSKTWHQRRHYSGLWWQPNSTRGYVWLDEKPPEWLRWHPVVSPEYRLSADTARFKYTCRKGSRSAVRIARIVKESFELGLGNVRWFVMGDDDTVFFPDNLVTVLRKYDHRELYYVGSHSESVEQDTEHSYAMAFGGAGFAISFALAEELVRILDGCIDRYAEEYGSDVKIGDCMSETGVPVTKEPGFHQMDIRGNALGLLSTHPLAPLVSLHHLDYVDPLFPDTNRVDSIKKLMNAYKSDPSRVLQHSFCYDLTRNWSISVAWGYTVQLYPFLLRPKELSTPLQTFLTWNMGHRPFTFNTRTYNLDPCSRPIVFYYDGVEKSGNGSTLTWYNRLGDEHRKKCGNGTYKDAYLVKGFKISASLFDPQLWNKAARRQVCEITRGSNQQNNVVNLIVRGFNQRESVTPP